MRIQRTVLSALAFGLLSALLVVVLWFVPWLWARVAIATGVVVAVLVLVRTPKNRILAAIELLVFTLAGSALVPDWRFAVDVPRIGTMTLSTGPMGTIVAVSLVAAIAIMTLLYRDDWDLVLPRLGRSGSSDDRRVYLETVAMLGPCVQWHRDWGGAGGRFQRQHLVPLDDYYHFERRPENRMINPALRQLQHKLAERTGDLGAAIGVNTFASDGGSNRVPPDWEHDRPEAWHSANRDLEKRTDDLIDAYEQFVTEAKRRLRL